MDKEELYIGSYRIEWSDQKIVVDCLCTEKELEIFSDSYTYCPQCSRRFSIVELVRVEKLNDYEEKDN
tara:strand:+ start:3215 stop:3418 length:204 start_codon:yes stop_codon:yes gene_type:complete